MAAINEVTDEIAVFAQDPGEAGAHQHIQRIARRMHDGLSLRLYVEAREVILRVPKNKKYKENEKVPHVMLFSNGDLTPFELILERPEEQRSITVTSNETGLIEEKPMEERRT